MAIGKAALVIADIGGYTRFMKLHRVNLAHAQLTVAGLLEAVIDEAGPLELVKLEGDAAFFWLKNPSEKTWAELSDVFAHMRKAFVAKRDDMAVNRMCDCDSCTQIDKLTLKFVAHEGEVAEQRVKRFVELAGVDVILVHRMLKNDVPLPEYVLFTDPVKGGLAPPLKDRAQPLVHDFEGLGQTQTYFVDTSTMEVAPRPARSPWLRRFLIKIVLELKGLPYVLGFREPTAGFRNGPKQLAAGVPGGATGL